MKVLKPQSVIAAIYKDKDDKGNVINSEVQNILRKISALVNNYTSGTIGGGETQIIYNERGYQSIYITIKLLAIEPSFMISLGKILVSVESLMSIENLPYVDIPSKNHLNIIFTVSYET